MGGANTKAAVDQCALDLEAKGANQPDDAVPWYSNVPVDENGCRIFPPIPPKGDHPRLLFTMDEIPRLLAQNTHTFLKDILQGSREARVRQFRQYYAVFQELPDSEKTNPGRATLDQYFVKDAGRNQSWFLSYVDAFLREDADLLLMVKEVVLFYARVIINSAALARTQGVTDGMYVNWISDSWDMQTTWLMGGFGFALVYDLMYNELSDDERDLYRLAISTAISGRRAWGMGWSSRRAQSNWAPYHGGLLALASVIEGEEGEDKQVVLQYTELMNNFLDFSIHDSGHPVEDCYFLNLACREGSVAFMVMARRGWNVFAKKSYADVYKKWVPFALDPYEGGEIYGGSSGSNFEYPSGLIVAKFMYPKDPAIDFAYRLFTEHDGKKYHRIRKQQTDFVAAMFAIPALNETLTPRFPGDDPFAATEVGLPKSFTCFNRGKVIMRSDWTQNAMSFTLDARPDCFLIGHDAPSRGAFVMHANGRQWAACPHWGFHKESFYYSLITIDGVGYKPKAPWVKLLSSAEGQKDSTYAAADLTYPANYEWTQWAREDQKNYNVSHEWEPEPQGPRDFGMTSWWLPNKIFDEPDVAFAGLFQWRKRFNTVSQITRSTLMVRDVASPFVIISDDAVAGDGTVHDYTWNMTMPEDTFLISFDGRDALVGEEGYGGRRLLVRLLDGSGSDNVTCNIVQSIVVHPGNDNIRHAYNRLQFKLNAAEAHFKIMFFPLETESSQLPTTRWATGDDGDSNKTLAVNGDLLINFENLSGGAKETTMKVVG